MRLFYPDTSAVMALFDEEDPLHEKAKEVIRGYRVADIFIPFNVQMEWQSRTMRELNRLIPRVVQHLDSLSSSGEENLSFGKFNAMVDRVANDVRELVGIERRKLDKVRIYLQAEIRNNFKESLLNIRVLKEHIVRLTYAVYERGAGVIQFFIENGYVHSDVSSEIEKKVKEYVAKNKIDLETSDSMILAELMKYALSDREDYDFVLGDRNLHTRGQSYIEKYHGVKDRIRFVFIGASS